MTELETLRARVAHLEFELKRHQTRMAGMITVEAVSETRWRNRELEAMVEDLHARAMRGEALPALPDGWGTWPGKDEGKPRPPIVWATHPSSPAPARAPSPALPATFGPRP